jgi:hypothetical protein
VAHIEKNRNSSMVLSGKLGLAPCGVMQGDPVCSSPVGCLIFEHQI